jgi:hypothetical protein
VQLTPIKSAFPADSAPELTIFFIGHGAGNLFAQIGSNAALNFRPAREKVIKNSSDFWAADRGFRSAGRAATVKRRQNAER